MPRYAETNGKRETVMVEVEPRLALINHIRKLQQQAEAKPCANAECSGGRVRVPLTSEQRTAGVAGNHVEWTACSHCHGRGFTQNMIAVAEYQSAVFKYLPYILRELESEIEDS